MIDYFVVSNDQNAMNEINKGLESRKILDQDVVSIETFNQGFVRVWFRKSLPSAATTVIPDVGLAKIGVLPSEEAEEALRSGPDYGDGPEFEGFEQRSDVASETIAQVPSKVQASQADKGKRK